MLLIPALIKHQGVVHLALLRDGGFNLIAPVTAAEQPKSPLPDDRYQLLCWGDTPEEVLRATGQWMPLLEQLAENVTKAMLTGAAKRAQGTDKRYGPHPSDRTSLMRRLGLRA